jgi:hypothetical protein
MKEEKVKCAWCERENIPKTTKERSDYGDIIVRRCSLCGKIMASYLDEKIIILDKVRTFQK